MGRSRQWVAWCCILMFLGAVAPSAYAASADGMMRKLGRGVLNVISSPTELIRTPELVGRQDGYPAALTIGITQGVWHTIARAAVGVFEIATFYAEMPRDYAPIIRPEFVWQHGNWAE